MAAARKAGIIEVQGRLGEEWTYHKCACRRILAVGWQQTQRCCCGRRYRWSAERTRAKKIVVIGEEKKEEDHALSE